MIAKRRLLPIHRWVGLALCLFMLVQAATGTALVFRYHLAEALDPAGMTTASPGPAAPISAVVRAARARFPGYAVEHVGFPQTDRGVYVAHLLNAAGESRWASVDPVSARVLRAGRIWAFPLEAAMEIHYRLMTGRLGLALMIASGVGLLIQALGGLAYWWPRAGRWRRSLAIPRGAPLPMLLRGLHRDIGVIAATTAIFSAATGLVVAVQFIAAPGPLMLLSAPQQTTAGDLDGALAQARAIYPGRAIRDVRTPKPGRFNVFFWAPEISPHAVNQVSLDPRDGRLLALTPATHAPWLWMTVLPIHSGDSFGAAGSSLVFAGGLALILLAVSGPVIWLLRPGRGAPLRPGATKTR